MLTFFAAFILLGLAIFVHEAGHFFLAKHKGVRVEKFSLGFGPKLFGFNRGGTEYLISAIPVGGYVKMAGDNPGEVEGDPDEFFSKSPVDRIKIVVAGPLMNVILAYILTTVLFAVGIRLPDYADTESIPAEVGEVTIGFPAYSAGIKTGDRIVAVSGEAVESWDKLAEIIHASADREVELSIERGEKTFDIMITPVSQDIVGESYGVIGIRPPSLSFSVMRFGWKSPVLALSTTAQQIGMTYKGLWLIATQRKLRRFVGGPMMIVQMAGEEARKGLSYFISLMVRINIMLAVINMVPFPVLDGGHCAFFLIEKLRKRPLSSKVQELLQQVGIAVLTILMLFLLMNDAMRQVGRMKAMHQDGAMEHEPETID